MAEDYKQKVFTKSAGLPSRPGLGAARKQLESQAAFWDSITSMVGANLEKNAIAAGEEQGANSVSVNEDGTVTRAEKPFGGIAFNASFESSQRQAAGKANLASFRNELGKLSTEIQFQPNRDALYVSGYEKLLSTFMGKIRPDIANQFQLEAELLGEAQGNIIHNSLVQEQHTDAQATIRSGLQSEKSDLENILSRDLGVVPNAWNEGYAISPLAMTAMSARAKNLREALDARAIKPKYFETEIRDIQGMGSRAILQAKTNDVAANSPEFYNMLEDYEKNGLKGYGFTTTVDKRKAISQGILSNVNGKITAYNAQKAANLSAFKLKTGELQVAFNTLEMNKGLINRDVIMKMSKDAGVDVNHPEYGIFVSKVMIATHRRAIADGEKERGKALKIEVNNLATSINKIIVDQNKTYAEKLKAITDIGNINLDTESMSTINRVVSTAMTKLTLNEQVNQTKIKLDNTTQHITNAISNGTIKLDDISRLAGSAVATKGGERTIEEQLWGKPAFVQQMQILARSHLASEHLSAKQMHLLHVVHNGIAYNKNVANGLWNDEHAGTSSNILDGKVSQNVKKFYDTHKFIPDAIALTFENSGGWSNPALSVEMYGILRDGDFLSKPFSAKNMRIKALPGFHNAKDVMGYLNHTLGDRGLDPTDPVFLDQFNTVLKTLDSPDEISAARRKLMEDPEHFNVTWQKFKENNSGGLIAALGLATSTQLETLSGQQQGIWEGFTSLLTGQFEHTIELPKYLEDRLKKRVRNGLMAQKTLEASYSDAIAEMKAEGLGRSRYAEPTQEGYQIAVGRPGSLQQPVHSRSTQTIGQVLESEYRIVSELLYQDALKGNKKGEEIFKDLPRPFTASLENKVFLRRVTGDGGNQTGRYHLLIAPKDGWRDDTNETELTMMQFGEGNAPGGGGKDYVTLDAAFVQRVLREKVIRSGYDKIIAHQRKTGGPNDRVATAIQTKFSTWKHDITKRLSEYNLDYGSASGWAAKTMLNVGEWVRPDSEKHLRKKQAAKDRTIKNKRLRKSLSLRGEK